MTDRDRWLAMIRDAQNDQGLDWIERQLLRRGLLDDIYREAIATRRVTMHAERAGLPF